MLPIVNLKKKIIIINIIKFMTYVLKKSENIFFNDAYLKKTDVNLFYWISPFVLHNCTATNIDIHN